MTRYRRRQRSRWPRHSLALPERVVMLRAPKSRVARASPRDIGANWSGRRMSKAASVSANALATATSELQGHRNQLQTLYAKPFPMHRRGRMRKPLPISQQLDVLRGYLRALEADCSRASYDFNDHWRKRKVCPFVEELRWRRIQHTR